MSGPDHAERLITALLDAHAAAIEEHEYSESDVIDNDIHFSRLRSEMLAVVRRGLQAHAASKGGG